MNFVLFFKQKTAYDMRISDWSSDVCSSDLIQEISAVPAIRQAGPGCTSYSRARGGFNRPMCRSSTPQVVGRARGAACAASAAGSNCPRSALPAHSRRVPTPRSEEHTSELQSLMRISYAVFCLKKKNKKTYSDII